MRFKLALRHVEYSIVIISTLPLAWLLSHGNMGIALSLYVYRVIGVWIPSFLLMLPVLALISLGFYILGGTPLKIVVFHFGLYILPALWGLPVNLLTGYTLGGVIYTGSLMLAKYIEWISHDIPGVSRDEFDSAGISAIREVIFPIPLGMGYFFLLFSWSSWARLPANVFPFYFILPFLVGAAVAVVSSFSGELRESPINAPQTFLVLRTHMTAGDSFTIEHLGRDERGVTFGLVGGSPVERPILLKMEWDEGLPEVIVLRSPWETKILTKKREWVEGNKRYVLFMA
ncbi:hypothetical protein [Thermococcus thermotolerans]|uniref:hypothetical protein n=1 Tax=Thermococcus thermotolerans TaxID=2969672 RepID=UPI0021571BB6|nr:hypothetical protein [Thermococcus thermotolerans]